MQIYSYPSSNRCAFQIAISGPFSKKCQLNGHPEVVIGAGDAVHFHRGFACMWHVTEPMKKNYAYFGDDGEEMPEAPEGISCDLCGAGCFAESYLHADEDGTELDLCCGCFRKGKKKYAGAEHQRMGEPVPPVVPAKKQRKE